MKKIQQNNKIFPWIQTKRYTKKPMSAVQSVNGEIVELNPLVAQFNFVLKIPWLLGNNFG